MFITEKGENVFFSCCAVSDDFEVLLSVNMRCRSGAIQNDEWVRVSHTYFSIICEALPRSSLMHWFWLCLKPADSIECVAESQPRGPAVEFSDGQRQIIFFFLYIDVCRFDSHAMLKRSLENMLLSIITYELLNLKWLFRACLLMVTVFLDFTPSPRQWQSSCKTTRSLAGGNHYLWQF